MDAAAHDQSAQSIPKKNSGKRLFGLLFLPAIVIAAAIFVCVNFSAWHDHFYPRRLRVLEPGLMFASGQIDQNLIRGFLTDHKIQDVVSLSDDGPTDPNYINEQAEQKACKNLGITWHVYPLSGDGTGDIHQYAAAVAEMAADMNAHKPVLMHCASGAQRSGGATFFYRVLVQHRSVEQALAELHGYWFSEKENPNLLPYLNGHIDEMAKLLVEKGVIEKVPEPMPRIPGYR